MTMLGYIDNDNITSSHIPSASLQNASDSSFTEPFKIRDREVKHFYTLKSGRHTPSGGRSSAKHLRIFLAEVQAACHEETGSV